MEKKSKTLRFKGTGFTWTAFLFLMMACGTMFPRVASAADSKALGPQSSQQIGGPLLGVLYEPATHKFRELVGVPGASFQGDLLDPGLPIVQSWISPRHDLAVAENANRQLLLLRFNPVPEMLALPGNPQWHPSRLSFSRDGNSAAAINGQTGELVVWRGLNAASPGSWNQPLVGVQGNVTAVAVSEDGGKVLLAGESGNGATLYLFTENGTPVVHQAAGAISAISIFPGGNKAVYADRAANELWLAESLSAAGSWIPLSLLPEKISDPVGIGTTQDGRKIVAANAGTATVLVYDLLDHQVETISCSQKPETLTPLIGPDVFLLNATGEGPLWLLQVDSGHSTTFFIPASRSAQGRALYDNHGTRASRSRNRERGDQ